MAANDARAAPQRVEAHVERILRELEKPLHDAIVAAIDAAPNDLSAALSHLGADLSHRAKSSPSGDARLPSPRMTRAAPAAAPARSAAAIWPASDDVEGRGAALSRQPSRAVNGSTEAEDEAASSDGRAQCDSEWTVDGWLRSLPLATVPAGVLSPPEGEDAFKWARGLTLEQVAHATTLVGPTAR